LSIRLPDGRYAAALVLAANHSHAEHGLDLIAALDFLSPDKTAMDVFRARKWLEVAWYHYIGFRAVKQRLEVVGRLKSSSWTRRTATSITDGTASVNSPFRDAGGRHDE
jgi:hypothetical protein